MSPPRKDSFPYLRRDLLDDEPATELAQLFKVLANDNRLRILHAIYLAGEVSPSEIAEAIGASQQTVSNQLQRLADQRIVHARRDGQHVLYRIIDPCVPGLMNLGVCLVSQRPQNKTSLPLRRAAEGSQPADHADQDDRRSGEVGGAAHAE